MTTYTLTVSTNSLGLGVINGAKASVERKRALVSELINGSPLSKNVASTNNLGVASFQLQPDDGSTFYELKIFDLVGIPIFYKIFQMPPVDISISDLPIQDIISASAQQAIQSASDANSSKVAAESAKTSSESARDAAAVSSTNANLSKVAAENAMNIATLSAGIYSSTALGIAATSNGSYFSVPSANNSEVLILYKNVSGVATDTLKRTPSKFLLDATIAALNLKATIAIGKNLYNPNDPDVAINYYVVGATGNIAALTNYRATGYIQVSGSTNYAVSHRHQYAWYDSLKNFISGSTTADNAPAIIASPSGAAYLRFSIYTTNAATFQVESGSANTAYEAYSRTLQDSLLNSSVTSEKLAASSVVSQKIADGAVVTEKIKRLSVNPTQTTFLVVGKNLFNKNAATIGAYCTNTNVVVASGTYDISEYIPITPGTAYKSNYNIRTSCYYSEDKSVISGGASSDITGFTAPSGSAFIRISIYHSNIDLFQLEIGTVSTSFERYQYLLSSLDGVPIVTSTVETDYLTISDKQYISYGKEISIYPENIIKDYKEYRGRVGISFSGGRETGESTKIIPTAGQLGSTISASAIVCGTDFSPLITKNFSIVVTNPNTSTPTNIQNIGDSHTGRMTWANVINASPAAVGLTFSGNRTSNNASPSVKCEGQGGWNIGSYFTVDYYGYLSPFMQPINSGYLYYGMTSFWIDANSATPSYNAGSFTGIKSLFNATTGRKISPNVNDVMGDGGGYIKWDGSAWVAVLSSEFGGFGFSYAKYRSAWSIPSPDILHVLLGTNDFSAVSESSFASVYAAYKSKYDQLISSVKSDTPTVKIIVGIPFTSGRQGKYGTLTTEKNKMALYLLAKKLNSDYGGREAESIYVLDYHSIVDRVYGYDNAYEPPFNDYSWPITGDGIYKSDNVHLGVDGNKQMGNAYMGLIQFLR
ncbi:MAG: hypothetical protein Q7S87_04685 [Agitococcus sp.]|nr:hypothetical protein [Agitococcus sp.]